MKTVTVTASKTYSVHIGSGILHSLGQQLSAAVPVHTAAMISDSNVWPLYGQAAQKSLQDAGFRVVSYVFPAGEESKNGNTYLQILQFLAQEQLTRSDCVIALGGGVVGDLAGFVAATFLRGIAYVQVPTTLLAAVDSSVGGKTAIDLPAGKNLAGAFCQPKLVLCDIDTLQTLPEDTFRDGCAEVIKYGILYDEALFSLLERHGLDFDRETVIARCVELKRDVVAADEFDRGARQKLNLGHTLGHGVEKNSHFALSHGKAVAIGTAMISRISSRMGWCDPALAERVEHLLEKFCLPTATHYTPEQLYQAALSDKKRAADTVTLVIPREIGLCDLCPTPVAQLKSLIETGY